MKNGDKMQQVQKKAVRADNLNEGFPGAKLPNLPSGARGESNAQKADFKDFKGLVEGAAKAERLPPPNPQAAAALNFGFPSRLPDEAVHGST